MDRNFISIYNQFTAAHHARNSNEMIKIMIAYKCETIAANRIQHHVYMFRTTFDCVQRMAKETPAKDVTKLVNQFEVLLAATAKYAPFQQFLTTLNILAQPEYLNGNASVLATAATVADTNMKQWMRTVNKHLTTAADNATDADDRKAIFLALTQSALIFFKLEYELRSGKRFDETKSYLTCCTKLEFLRSDKYAGDYVQCFNVMANYAKAWENGAADWQKIINEISNFVA